MVKRLCALLCALMLPLSALADITWPASMQPGQLALKTYIEQVNQNQSQQQNLFRGHG